jgi:hypothetical protein
MKNKRVSSNISVTLDELSGPGINVKFVHTEETMKNNTIKLSSRLPLSDIYISGPLSGRASALSPDAANKTNGDEGYTYLTLTVEPSPSGMGPPKNVELRYQYSTTDYTGTDTGKGSARVIHSHTLTIPIDTIMEWAKVLSTTM